MAEADEVLRSIDQLRRDLSGYHGQLKAHNDLQRHCDNQRKRIVELEGLYAESKAERDNLRELAANLYRCARGALRDLAPSCADGSRDGCGMDCTANGESCCIALLEQRVCELGIDAE